MTDRDRLAADLRDAAGAFADDPAAYLDRGDAYDAMADRLIALGWHKGLDEERLVRALHAASPGYIDISDDMVLGDEYGILAAAIAKAYREDTDAR